MTDIIATLRESIAHDPELSESLAIITGTLETIDAEPMIWVAYRSSLASGIVTAQYADMAQAKRSLRHRGIKEFSALENGTWTRYETGMAPWPAPLLVPPME